MTRSWAAARNMSNISYVTLQHSGDLHAYIHLSRLTYQVKDMLSDLRYACKESIRKKEDDDDEYEDRVDSIKDYLKTLKCWTLIVKWFPSGDDGGFFDMRMQDKLDDLRQQIEGPREKELEKKLLENDYSLDESKLELLIGEKDAGTEQVR